MRLTAKNASRFSIATLLLITAAVAGYFGGRERGYIQGQRQWQTMPQMTRSYFVGDITQPKTETSVQNRRLPSVNIRKLAPTLNELASNLNQQVIPDNWKRGKLDVISVDAWNASLIVSGNSLVHAEVANYLAYLRAEKDVRTYGIGQLFEDD